METIMNLVIFLIFENIKEKIKDKEGIPLEKQWPWMLNLMIALKILKHSLQEIRKIETGASVIIVIEIIAGIVIEIVIAVIRPGIVKRKIAVIIKVIAVKIISAIVVVKKKIIIGVAIARRIIRVVVIATRNGLERIGIIDTRWQK